MDSTFSSRFRTYFEREVAEAAAKSLSTGAEIEMRVGEEKFTFTRLGGKNAVVDSPAKDPQLTFTLTPQAAEDILSNPSEDMGAIAVSIAKMIVSTDANRRVTIKFHTGFLGLFTKGYFGILKAGGAKLATYLASVGLGGMDAIKAVLRKK